MTQQEKEAILADLARREEAARAAAPAVTPCPEWCDGYVPGNPRDHREWDVAGLGSDDGTRSPSYSRNHYAQIGKVTVVAYEECRATLAVLATPTMYVDEEGLNVEQARQLAADLLNAADMLDKITPQQ
jgi:hypothetical protein